MRILVATALLAVSMSSSACSHDRNASAGPRISRSYPVGSFDQIEVAGPYQVRVRTGAQPSVSATGAQKVLEKTEAVVEGRKLIIRPVRPGWFGGWTTGTIDVAVTVPTLSAVALTGSGSLDVNRIETGQFAGEVAGSGNLRLGDVAVESLKIGIAGSGDFTAGTGHARSAEYELAGSGGLDAGSVASEQLKVSIAGSGSVRAAASRSAKIDIMGSGSATVSGGAKCSVSKMGSGQARCS